MPLSRAAIVVLASLAAATPAAAAAEPALCASEVAALTASVETRDKDAVPERLAARVEHVADRAIALVRFHRSSDALGKLDALVTVVDGPRGHGLRGRTRSAITTSVHALRTCLQAVQPSPLVPATIRTFVQDDTAEGGAGKPGGEGAYIDIEGIRIGRTGPDGTLQAELPAGAVRVKATDYDVMLVGMNELTVSPGSSPETSIVLVDGKEPSEDSELVLEEAPDEILPATATSLTLKFVQDDEPVRIERIEGLELWLAPGQTAENLEGLFRVRQGVIEAIDPSAVQARLARHARIGKPYYLSAYGIDMEGRSHHSEVRFHIGRHNLLVALGAPPSNPALPVSNISVRVKVMGTDLTVGRESDADGRFQIDGLPEGTLAFDAETVADGIYYYAHAVMTLCADRSVTVLMLNVKDLVNGVPALVNNDGAPPCPAIPRR